VDAALKDVIARVHQERFGVYGMRKLRRQTETVDRDQVGR
jgi:hypothetical protein